MFDLFFSISSQKTQRVRIVTAKSAGTFGPKPSRANLLWEKAPLPFLSSYRKKPQITQRQTFDARVTVFTLMLRFSQHHGTNIMAQSFPAIAKSSLFLSPCSNEQQIPDALLHYKHNLHPPTKCSTYVESEI